MAITGSPLPVRTFVPPPSEHSFRFPDGTWESVEIRYHTPAQYDRWPHRGERDVSTFRLAGPDGALLIRTVRLLVR